MTDKAEDELAATRAALAPTLEATAAILPFLARPQAPRFPPELSGRWQEACQRLGKSWNERHGDGLEEVRPAVFELIAVAIELADRDCLRLAEALATACDALDADDALEHAPLVAAISAAVECLGEPNGLEHVNFSQRFNHFAQRLENCPRRVDATAPVRPPIDRLFFDEARECLEHVLTALQRLPADAQSAREAAELLTHLAEPLELHEVVSQGKQLADLLIPSPGRPVDLDNSVLREAIHDLVGHLAHTLDEILSAQG